MLASGSGAWNSTTPRSAARWTNTLDPARASGGHGGGDRVMLDDLYGAASSWGVGSAATPGGLPRWRQSILTGIAANPSIEEGQPCRTANWFWASNCPTPVLGKARHESMDGVDTTASVCNVARA